MSGHTPGPWEVHLQASSFGEAQVLAKTEYLGYVVVAKVAPPHNDQLSVYGGAREANARLIAAAPRMADYIRLHAERDPEARAILQEAGVIQP